MVGGIEIAKGIAEGALETANEGLTLAIDALEASGAVLPDLDPVVITLRAAYVMFSHIITRISIEHIRISTLELSHSNTGTQSSTLRGYSPRKR